MKEIYGNHNIYSPNGQLMCRGDLKKVNWYLKRNLAEKISQERMDIKLLFEPKSLGDHPELLKIERKNQCASCGTNENLTKHHIIPQEFRKHFPEKYKNSLSILVVPLCDKCHSNYEKNATNLKKHLIETNKEATAKELNLQKEYSQKKKIYSLINYYKNNPNKILLEKIKNFLPDFNSEISFEMPIIPLVKTMGEIIVEQFNKPEHYVEFSKLWINDFFSNVSTKHACPNFKKEILLKVIKENFTSANSRFKPRRN